MTSVGTAPAADAGAQVERIRELHARSGLDVADGDHRAIAMLGLGLEPRDEPALVIGAQLLVVLREQLLHARGLHRLQERRDSTRKGGGAERGPRSLQHPASADVVSSGRLRGARRLP